MKRFFFLLLLAPVFAFGAANDVTIKQRNATNVKWVDVVLTDPGADTLIGWDDSAGAVVYFTFGSGISTTDTAINVSGGTDDQTAAEVSVAATPSNYTPGSATVEAHLAGIDTAIGSLGGGHDAVTLGGSLDYLTLTDQVITRGAIVLTTDVSGTLPIANGGTGATDAAGIRTAINVADGATANSADATLLARANHTGTQAASTISDFDTEVANNSAVTANTAKVTNATHTGDVTGSGALTIAAGAVQDDEIDYTAVTLNDFTFDVGSVSKTEFGYLDGVTSAIQTQLTAKLESGDNIGAATATTPAANDDDTSVATTEYVQDELTAYASDTVTFTNKTITDAKFILGSVALAGTVIDTTEGRVQTKTISDSLTTFTFDAAPPAGSTFFLEVTNDQAEDETFDIPANFSYTYNGDHRNITVPASSPVLLQFRYDGSQYKVSTPVDFFADIPEDTTPTNAAVDSFGYVDDATRAAKRMPLATIATLPIVTASGFDGNLATTDDTLQEIAQKVDDLVITGTDDQTAAEVPVVTTAFAGNFANNASHDTAQELFDIIDDLSLSGLANIVEDTTPTLGGELDGGAFDIVNLNSLILNEQASESAPGDGKGRYWVINSTPSRPRFMDDAGTNHAIIHGVNTAVQDRIIIGGSGGGGYVVASSATVSTAGTLSIPSGQTIELGAATDTTIARSAAGRITVEGVEVSMTGENVMTPKSTATTYTIGTTNPLELKGGYIIVTAATTITVPTTITTGMNWSVKANVADAVVVNPDDTHTITLDGVALSAGDSITSTSTLGDLAVFVVTSSTTIDVTTNGWTDTN